MFVVFIPTLLSIILTRLTTSHQSCSLLSSRPPIPPAQNLGEQTAQDDRVALGEPMNRQATVGAHTGAPVKESGLMVQTGGGSRRSSTLASPGSSVLGGGAGADGFGNGAAAGGWRQGVTGAAGQAPAARDRKLCLFNLQVLATNVAEAREIIDTPNELVPHTSNKVPPPSHRKPPCACQLCCHHRLLRFSGRARARTLVINQSGNGKLNASRQCVRIAISWRGYDGGSSRNHKSGGAKHAACGGDSGNDDGGGG
ncbi:hypothetical protein PCANC_21040 [Puccinia coronata f. sp. avenae]|uniref:Uncharacterized protein n=1 Tax=Puccinia coronata f. sp. avenae TaxID=200324 RepID=A0A2N5TWB9_9BASI|nr:hypothetical protein PCANC_21040 [Puccinia coronata f. sp. avenae]